MTEQREPWPVVVEGSTVLANATMAVGQLVTIWAMTHATGRQPLQGVGSTPGLWVVIAIPPVVWAGLWLWQRSKG